MKVNVINPKRRKRTGKKTARKRAPVAKKKATRRRRRAPARKAPARRRRASNPAPKRRRRSGRRRASNPTLAGGLTQQFQRFVPRLAGKLWVAWTVQRWGAIGGAGGSLMGGPVTSQTAGSSWTFGQYILAGFALHFGSKIFGRFLSASEFLEGGWDLIFTKLVWTEGIARSDWAVQQFGNPQIRQSPDGQTWMAEGGQWNALQGELVAASPLDGELVAASPLDGPRSHSYGHLLPADVSEETARQGRYTGSGFTSAYNASYAGV